MEIVLNDNRAQYECGQTVTGVVRVTANDHSQATDVKIALTGLEEVKWFPENLFSSCALTPLTFHETTKCLELEQQVEHEQVIVKQDNVHEFPFGLKLPDECIPSSFRGVHGTIVYKITATIKTSDDRVQHTEREIQVQARLKQKFNISVMNGAEKDFGHLSFGSGRIMLHASILRKCYAPGDHIVLHCNVYNDSTVECTPRATLFQTQIYLFIDRHKGFQKAITEPVFGDKVTKDSNGTQVLTIPLPEDTTLSIKTRLIAVKYFIHVTVDIPHAFDIHVNLPFVVTTKPTIDSK